MTKRCFLVAELSANHNHSLETARKTVLAAAAAGADAVKLQTYTADTLTLDCDKEYFRIRGTAWDGMNLHALYRQAYTPWEWHADLQRTAVAAGLQFFSTPFDATAVDFLEALHVPMHKVASFELIDIPLLEKVGRTRKPVILSTGMASLSEIEEAVAALRGAGCPDLTLLRCVSAYPASPENMNLATLPDMRAKFGAKVGLSDHTRGTDVAVAAVALGAEVIEKHFILDRTQGGPDSRFSCEPAEFRRMAEAVRVVEKAVGEPRYGCTPEEEPSKVFRRSLFVTKNMKAGETFTEENVRSIRPAYGLPPKQWRTVLGKRAACDIAAGTPLREGLIG